ncbi:OppA family ABC transporter substrate-binding lipoprotein [Mycoplasmopsis columboralis]|uniref:Lipoprotein n=1 Tax=Mycoplasmopsis columboralis TaxID=171282 RepID=A0A449B660_9BACT|nr:hypothetical protein [Mycoplasmopsis columboralis]VEU76100.1 Uncharacterised protein [Mycoplasmopsis columboralis]
MKIKRIWFALPLVGLSSLATIACVSPSSIKTPTHYVKTFNYANTYADGVFPIFENRKYQNEIEKNLFAPLIKYTSFDDLLTDKVNNLIVQSSKTYLSFYLAKSLKVYFDNKNTLTYNNDNYKDNSLFAQKYLEILHSNDVTSINHKDFFDNLNKAWKIEFELKDNLYYSNYQGAKTQIAFKVQDLLSRVTASDVAYFQNNYGVELKIENNKFVIYSTKHKLSEFFENELMKNLIFNPSPENIVNKNYQNSLYLSKYVPLKNQIDQITLLKNTNSPDELFNESLSNLNEITLNFNPTPLDVETFRIQQLRSYRQNLISEIPYNLFNSTQKDDILSRSRQYGLRETIKTQNLASSQRFLYTTEYQTKKIDAFNTNFKNFYFKKSKESYLFKYYLSRLYSLFAKSYYLDNPYYWNSLSLPSTLFENNFNEQNGFVTLSDASTLLNEQTIFLNSKNEFRKINFYNLQNEFFKNEKILDFQQQLKNLYFDEIVKELNLLITEFIQTNKLPFGAILEFEYPILNTYSEKEISLHQEYLKMLNGVSKNLNIHASFVDIDSFKNKNYFIEPHKIEYPSKSLESFINTIFDTSEINQYLKSNFLNNSYSILDQNNINKDSFIEIIKTHNIQDQIKLINDLNNLIPLPFEPLNVNTSKNLNKILVQQYYTYPLFEDGITSFEDIKIK